MFENMFEKALKLEKGRQWSIPDNFPFFQMKNKYRVYVFLELTGQTSVIYIFSYFPIGQTSVLHLSILFFTPPMLQTSDFGR